MLRFEAAPCPLLLGSDGAIRVKGSAVTLELVVGAYDAGATPEQIAHHCPSLTLSTIHSVLSYVLAQRAEVDQYLRARAGADRALASYEGATREAKASPPQLRQRDARV